MPSPESQVHRKMTPSQALAYVREDNGIQDSVEPAVSAEEVFSEPNTKSSRELLNEVLYRDPSRFNQLTVARVLTLVKQDEKYPDQKRRRYGRYLIEPDDFELYHRLRPEWKDKAISELASDEETGGAFFIAAFHKMRRDAGLTRREKDELTRRIFPEKKSRKRKKDRDGSGLREIREWVAGALSKPSNEEDFLRLQEFSHLLDQRTDEISGETIERVAGLLKREHEHPQGRRQYGRLLRDLSDFELYDSLRTEWKGKIVSELFKDIESGGKSFVLAFRKCRIHSELTYEEKRNITRRMFSRKKDHRRDWGSYQTLEDWIKLARANGWEGKSSTELIKGNSNGNTFYLRFLAWVRETYDSREEREQARRTIIPLKKRKKRSDSVRKTVVREPIKTDIKEKKVIKRRSRRSEPEKAVVFPYAFSQTEVLFLLLKLRRWSDILEAGDRDYFQRALNAWMPETGLKIKEPQETAEGIFAKLSTFFEMETGVKRQPFYNEQGVEGISLFGRLAKYKPSEEELRELLELESQI